MNISAFSEGSFPGPTVFNGCDSNPKSAGDNIKFVTSVPDKVEDESHQQCVGPAQLSSSKSSSPQTTMAFSAPESLSASANAGPISFLATPKTLASSSSWAVESSFND